MRAGRRFRSIGAVGGRARRLCRGRPRSLALAFGNRGAGRAGDGGCGARRRRELTPVPYKFAFVMDELERIDQYKDTTFVFMVEALARGHEVYFLALSDLFARADRAMGFARRCAVMRETAHYRWLDSGGDYPLDSFDAIFMRKDPPADAAYLYATMLLSLADPRRTFVLNNPAGLREANEKLYALNFPDAIPPTLVTYEIPRLKTFLTEN